MPRFDVWTNPSRRTAREIPFLLSVQHELFDDLATVVVVPCFRASAVPRPFTKLTPTIELAGERVVVMMPELSGVPRSALGEKVGNAAAESAAILGALDFLISGG